MTCKDTDDYSKKYKMELRKRREEDKLKMQKEKRQSYELLFTSKE